MERTDMNLIYFVVVNVLASHVMSQGHEDMYEMKRDLDKIAKQNRALMKQMSTITSGLTEMCRAVNLATCDCADKQSENGQGFTAGTEELKLISLVSHGEVNNSVKLTLTFEATDKYSIEWYQGLFPGTASVRTAGIVKTTRLPRGRTVITSNVEIFEIPKTNHLVARIYSPTNTGSLEINMTAIVENGEQTFDDIEYRITRYPRQIILPNELPEQFNVTVYIDRNILDLMERRRGPGGSDMSPDIYMTIMNTTSKPNTILEVYSHTGILISQTDNGIGDIEVALTLHREHIENGGMLAVSLPQPVGMYTRVWQHGVVIDIRRDQLTPYVPPGSIALYDNPEEIYVATSVASVFCFVMGNPRPDVTMYKERNGRLKEVPSEPLVMDDFVHLRSLTLRDTGKKGKSLRGTYVCKATNGNETIERKTTLVQYRGIQFDESKTGVTVNSTKKVVVSCKASGSPAPKIAVRLGSDYGPDLLEAEGNFTYKSTTKGGVSKVVLTFSPPDYRFDVLYCAAIQTKSSLYEQEIKEIRIIPESVVYQSEFSYERWTFYDSFRKPEIIEYP